MINKINFNRILVYILCVLIVLDQSIFSLSGSGKYIKLVVLAVTVMLGLISVLGSYKKDQFKTVIIFIMVLTYEIILVLINIYNHNVAIKSFIVLYAVLPFMFLYFSSNKLEEVDNSYLLGLLAEIITIFAVFSLFMWFIVSIAHLIGPTNYILLNWGNPHFIPTYFNVYFETQDVHFGSFVFMRNTFIYPEGPIYSYYLSLALIINVFIKKSKIFSTSSIIIMLAILSTGSSTGVLILSGIILTMMIINIKDKNKVLAVIVSIIMFLLFMLTFYLVINQKKMDNANSLNVRISDIMMGFRIGAKHIFIGNGYGNYSVLLDNMELNRISFNGNSGFSSGLSLIAAYGGISLLALYIIPIFNGVIYGRRWDMNILFFSLMILFLLVSTIVQSNQAMLVSLVYLFTRESKSNLGEFLND